MVKLFSINLSKLVSICSIGQNLSTFVQTCLNLSKLVNFSIYQTYGFQDLQERLHLHRQVHLLLQQANIPETPAAKVGAAAAEMAGVEIALGGRTTRALNCLMKIPTWLRWVTGMSPSRPLPWTAVSMNLDIWMKDLQKVREFL